MLPFQQLTKPGETLAVTFWNTCPFLVHPVCRNAFIGDMMHVIGPNLNFNPLTMGTNHGGMKGLVHVCLGHPYVIFEAARNGFPQRVNHTQGLITLANGFQDDTERYDVIDVLQIQVLGDHLLVYAKDILGSAVHFPLQAEIRQLFLDDTPDFLDVTLALLFIPFQATNNLLIHIRIKIGEGKVLQLGPDPVNTEPPS